MAQRATGPLLSAAGRDPSAAPRESDLPVARLIVEATVTAVAYALLNYVSGRFQVAPDVSILFLPTALAVVSAFRIGFWAVPAVIAGTLLSPWASSESRPLVNLAYALANSLEALAPALLVRLSPRFDRTLGDARSFLRYVGVALVVGPGANALAGNLVRSATSPGEGNLAPSMLLWWVADLSAALILATPILVAPPLVRDSRRAPQEATRGAAAIASGLVVVAVLVGASLVGGFGLFHWFSVLFLVPVLWASHQNGFRAGITTAAAASILYLGVLLGLAPATAFSANAAGEAVVTVYLNALVFFATAALTGLLSNQRRRLLADLDRRNRTLKDDFFRIVSAFSAAIEARDRATVGHVYRVARTSVALGRALGLPEDELEILNYGAILHDVGKFGIPDRILLKSSPLTDEERALVRRHGEIGADILRNVDILRDVVPVVQFHQKSWDGCYGLEDRRARGEEDPVGEIPLHARIVAVADAYDALTSDRPWRQAFARESALEQLRAERGKRFDPTIVDALAVVLQDTGVIRRGVVPVRVGGD